jgi:hypothetical protein
LAVFTAFNILANYKFPLNEALGIQGRFRMNSSTKIWLLYSVFGLILSILITSVFDAYPNIRFISNEGIVFGVMSATMGFALKKLSTGKIKKNGNDA